MQPFLKALSVCLFCILILASCKNESDPTPGSCEGSQTFITIAPDEEIRIGVLQALSGGNAVNGLSLVRSIQLALDEHHHRLCGHPLRLQVEDSGCSAEMGRASALKIAMNLKIVGVIGTFCSGSAATASKVITQSGMTMISGANSAPSLTSVEGKPGANRHSGYFRVMFNGTQMARAAAHFAFHQLDLRKAAAINDGSLYTSEYTSEFVNAFEQLGGDIVMVASVDKGDKNMVPVITSLVLSDAQCTYFPLYQREAELLVRQLHEVEGAEQIVYIGGGALLTESFIQSSGPFVRGMYFASVLLPNGQACHKLKQRYLKKYGELPQHFSYAHTYDATNLLLSAIKTAATHQKDGSLLIDRIALRDALHETRNFEGVTGRLNCDEFGDCSADTFKIVRLDDPSAGLNGLKTNIVYTCDSPI